MRAIDVLLRLKELREATFRAELTAKLVEVCLDFPPGVEEHSPLFCADGDHAVLVHGDARHLGV